MVTLSEETVAQLVDLLEDAQIEVNAVGWVTDSPLVLKDIHELSARIDSMIWDLNLALGEARAPG